MSRPLSVTQFFFFLFRTNFSAYNRKVCQNCRCGKAEHNVQDVEDPGFYFVGKIFDRPLRTRQEEMEFCYGDVSDSDDSSDGSSGGSLGSAGGGGRGGSGGRAGWSGGQKGALKKTDGAGGGQRQRQRQREKKTVRFEWVPPNISLTLVRESILPYRYASFFFLLPAPSVFFFPDFVKMSRSLRWLE